MSAQPHSQLTYAQYLELEQTSDLKHEYLRGEAWAMAGGAPTHARIAMNVALALGTALRGKPCSVFGPDLRIRVVETDRSTYPDVFVICGKRQTASDDEQAVVNPILIVEVLSDSTEASDRGEKFAHFQRLASLQEYVLVNQRSHRVEVFRRGEGTMWMLNTHVDGSVDLKSIDTMVKVADIYDDPTG